MVSLIGALVRKENAGEIYLNTELKNLLIRTKKDATAIKARIKFLDKNYDDIFRARTAWSLLIRLFSVFILEIIL
jgi:hypothetical protein